MMYKRTTTRGRCFAVLFILLYVLASAVVGKTINWRVCSPYSRRYFDCLECARIFEQKSKDESVFSLCCQRRGNFYEAVCLSWLDGYRYKRPVKKRKSHYNGAYNSISSYYSGRRMRLGDVTRTMTCVMVVCCLYILCCQGARPPPHEMDICVTSAQITEHCLKCGQIVVQSDPAESIYKKCCRKSTNFYNGVCRELMERYKTRAPTAVASGSGRETDNSDNKKEPKRW